MIESRQILPQETLKQAYLRGRQQAKPAPDAKTPRPIIEDPLIRWTGRNIVVTFASGLELTGKLIEVCRYAIHLEDGDSVHHLYKTGIERITLAVNRGVVGEVR